MRLGRGRQISVPSDATAVAMSVISVEMSGPRSSKVSTVETLASLFPPLAIVCSSPLLYSPTPTAKGVTVPVAPYLDHLLHTEGGEWSPIYLPYFVIALESVTLFY